MYLPKHFEERDPERLRSLAERVVAVGGRLDSDRRSVLRAELPIDCEQI